MEYLSIFDFTNFYQQFIKSFSKIASSLILILKIINLLISVKLVQIKTNKNKVDIESNSSIGNINNARIKDRIANLLNNIKVKKRFKIDFLISDTSLAYTQLKKIFIKALIIYHFNLKH